MNIRSNTHLSRFGRLGLGLVSDPVSVARDLLMVLVTRTSRPCGRRDACRPVRPGSTVRPAGLQSRALDRAGRLLQHQYLRIQRVRAQNRDASAWLGGPHAVPVLAPDRLPAIAPRAGHRTPGCCRRIRGVVLCPLAAPQVLRHAAPSGTSCRATDGKGEEARPFCVPAARAARQLRLPRMLHRVPPIGALPGARRCCGRAAARAVIAKWVESADAGRVAKQSV